MVELEQMISRAKKAPKHIVLAEGMDERIIKGGLKAARNGSAKITLLGNPSEILPTLDQHRSLPPNLKIVPPSARKDYVQAFTDLRKHKGMTADEAAKIILNPLIYANLMVHLGDADGTVAGALNTTSDVVRAALQIIGVDKNYSLVSSLFLMLMPDSSHTLKGGTVFSDCGLVINPDAQQLSEIAAAAADNARLLLGLDPKIAMLSFSTKDSAVHSFVEKVKEATDLLKQKRQDLRVDGELQFDAAIMPHIAAKKAPNSNVAGQANVFIFPDLNAGNIGYKIAERLGGVKAIGPILQGLNKPANDLSRGCDAEAVYNMIIVTVLQAQAYQKQIKAQNDG